MALIGGAPGQANRFCGSSCVISLKGPSVLGLLDSVTEGVLVADIKPPGAEKDKGYSCIGQ